MPDPRVRLTRLELEIMDRLWTLSEASVRDVLEAIPAESRPAYTTVQTILSRLEEKRAIRRVRKIGKAIVFAPAITRQSIYKRLIDELLDLFGGNARPMVSHLVESGKLTLRDVREIEASARKGGKQK